MIGSEARFLIGTAEGAKHKRYLKIDSRENGSPVVLTSDRDPKDQLSKIVFKQNDDHLEVAFDCFTQPRVAATNKGKVIIEPQNAFNKFLTVFQKKDYTLDWRVLILQRRSVNLAPPKKDRVKQVFSSSISLPTDQKKNMEAKTPNPVTKPFDGKGKWLAPPSKKQQLSFGHVNNKEFVVMIIDRYGRILAHSPDRPEPFLLDSSVMFKSSSTPGEDEEKIIGVEECLKTKSCLWTLECVDRSLSKQEVMALVAIPVVVVLSVVLIGVVIVGAKHSSYSVPPPGAGMAVPLVVISSSDTNKRPPPPQKKKAPVGLLQRRSDATASLLKSPVWRAWFNEHISSI
eukprot:TRINITY_DN1412_c0_g1_i1.p1 TRINITY_DN1412_c0_g1~~TRINITY_DN1412_c0_g1_i1.p1  ORF type:complete len:343 (-),score=81.38 TRINITY_DN1412_c0_g1_i1:45-1073(-)